MAIAIRSPESFRTPPPLQTPRPDATAAKPKEISLRQRPTPNAIPRPNTANATLAPEAAPTQYARHHEETLNPEQQDLIRPVLDLCTEHLKEGEEVLILGSHGIAPALLSHLANPASKSRYKTRMDIRDYDIHTSNTEVYNRLVSSFEAQQIKKEYPFGTKTLTSQGVEMDIINDAQIASMYLEEMFFMESMTWRLDTTETRNALDKLKQGDYTQLPTLLGMYALDTVGVKIVMRNGIAIPTLFDPLHVLERVTITEDAENPTLHVSDSINPHSVSFLFLTLLGEQIRASSSNPYATHIERTPALLELDRLENLATSSLDLVPRVAKGLLTHEIVPESFYNRHVLNTLVSLARLDPEISIQNKYIAKFRKSVQEVMADNLDKFTDALTILTETLPLGWCLSLDDLSSESHTGRSPVKIGNAFAHENYVVNGAAALVEKHGNPTNLEEALALYLIAESGYIDDKIQKERTFERLYNWWVPNYPELDHQKMLNAYEGYGIAQSKSASNSPVRPTAETETQESIQTIAA